MLSVDYIKNITFKKAKFGGYKSIEVDSFLDDVQISYEKLQSENLKLKAEINELNTKLEKYHEEEGCIRNAILSAQKLADASLVDANNKSESIILEASRQADRILNETKAEVERQKKISWSLYMESERFRSKVIKSYESQVDMLKELVIEYNESDNNDNKEETKKGKIDKNVLNEVQEIKNDQCISGNLKDQNTHTDLTHDTKEIQILNSENDDSETKICNLEIESEKNSKLLDWLSDKNIQSNDNTAIKEMEDIDSGIEEDRKEIKKKKIKNLKFGSKYRLVGHEFGKGLYAGLFKRKK